MARPIVAKKVHHCTPEFKIPAVRLALHPEIQTQDVAHALDIHPFMLWRWKKDYREGRLKREGTWPLPQALRCVQKLQRKVRELEAKAQTQTRMRDLERRYEALRVENVS